MRLASFNVENLFSRAKALNRDEWLSTVGDDPANWTPGHRALEYYGELNALFRKSNYSAADKAQMVQLLSALGLANSDESSFVILRKNRGTLLKRPQGGGLQIVANGRDDWIGWLELKKEAVNEVATKNTARVLDLLQADVTVVIEAEDRISLCRFNEQVLNLVGGALFDQIMLIDGMMSAASTSACWRVAARPSTSSGAMSTTAMGAARFSAATAPNFICASADQASWSLPITSRAKATARPPNPTRSGKRRPPEYAQSTMGCARKASTASRSPAISMIR